MEYVTLKNSNLTVSRLAMGGCPMGGHGWGEVNDKKLVESVERAVSMGINFFDTADIYGLGKSEKILGEALGKNRHQAVIATKFGVRIQNGVTSYDNSKDWIHKALRSSLKRLNTDYIDLYQIHYRDGFTPMEEVIDVLDRLKEAGYIRYYGLSNNEKKDLDELTPYIGKFSSIQNEYSLACRRYEKDIVDIQDILQVTPMTWGSLGQGILTGKYDDTVQFSSNDRRSREIYVNFHGEKLKKNLSIVKELQKLGQERNKPIPAIAIRYILDKLQDSVVIAGIKNSSQLESNGAAMDWHLSNEQIKRLDAISQE